MHDIAQKQIFFRKLPELDPDPDLVVKYPDPQHCLWYALYWRVSQSINMTIVDANRHINQLCF
jgi:hypothetical protein